MGGTSLRFDIAEIRLYFVAGLLEDLIARIHRHSLCAFSEEGACASSKVV